MAGEKIEDLILKRDKVHLLKHAIYKERKENQMRRQIVKEKLSMLSLLMANENVEIAGQVIKKKKQLFEASSEYLEDEILPDGVIEDYTSDYVSNLEKWLKNELDEKEMLVEFLELISREEQLINKVVLKYLTMKGVGDL